MARARAGALAGLALRDLAEEPAHVADRQPEVAQLVRVDDRAQRLDLAVGDVKRQDAHELARGREEQHAGLAVHLGGAALELEQLGLLAEPREQLQDLRAAVLGLRRGKGMVLDGADHDTWSVGSFFTNPVLPEDEAPAVEGLARWPAGPGRVKLSAAGLIERSGFHRGHPGPGGRVGVSTKHVLALTNRGGGTTADLLALAGEVRRGVRERFGVDLVPEPVMIGCWA